MTHEDAVKIAQNGEGAVVSELMRLDGLVASLTRKSDARERTMDGMAIQLEDTVNQRDMAEDRCDKLTADVDSMLKSIHQLTTLNTRQSQDITELRHRYAEQERRIANAIDDLMHGKR